MSTVDTTMTHQEFKGAVLRSLQNNSGEKCKVIKREIGIPGTTKSDVSKVLRELEKDGVAAYDSSDYTWSYVGSQ